MADDSKFTVFKSKKEAIAFMKARGFHESCWNPNYKPPEPEPVERGDGEGRSVQDVRE